MLGVQTEVSCTDQAMCKYSTREQINMFIWPFFKYNTARSTQHAAHSTQHATHSTQYTVNSRTYSDFFNKELSSGQVS